MMDKLVAVVSHRDYVLLFMASGDERASIIPLFIILGAAICAFLGLGLLAVRCHVLGIFFLIAAIGLFLLPYHFNSLYRRSENILVKPVIIAELELSDIEMKVLFAYLVEGSNAAALDQVLSRGQGAR